MRTLTVLAALTVLMTACTAGGSDREPARDPGRSEPTATTAETDRGRLEGVRDGEVVRFRGIPYAQPPVGSARWTAPRPVERWSGTRRATTSGPTCPQPSAGAEQAAGRQSEDCLFLDVTVPSKAKKDRPVMVWVHGGSLQTGSGSQYDAADLAAKGDVVVVTVNYRLSAMGFLALPGMSGPAGAFGLADQQEALRFVRENASAFGGDEENVTLFGESGGGVSTCAQLTAPGARGLFERAVVQSAVGYCGDPIEPGAVAPAQPRVSNFAPREVVEQTSLKAAAALGCGDPATAERCLRTKPAEDLVKVGQDLVLPAYGGDDALLPTSPAKAIASGDVADVPVLSGFTSDEPSFFLAQAVLAGMPDLTAVSYAQLIGQELGPRAAEVLRRYPASRYPSPNAAWVAVHTDGGWACPAVRLNDSLARRGPVYGYEFADRTSPPAFDYPDSVTPGASHGAEIPYLFGVTDGYGTQSLGSLNPAQARLSERTIAMWSRFAHDGDPGTPRWGDSDIGALLGGGSTTANLAERHGCDFWDR